MRRFLSILILAICAAAPLTGLAQQKLSDSERQKYLQEMRIAKHEFLVKELELTREQQNAFFPVYDEMDDQLNKIADETRLLESKVSNDTKASDTEIESAARAIFEQKMKEGNIEIEYFAKFKEILKPRQLLSLKNAERKFTQQLVRKHRRMRD